jgi:hypothetical protein
MIFIICSLNILIKFFKKINQLQKIRPYLFPCIIEINVVIRNIKTITL